MENIKDFWGNMFTSPIISNHLETWIIEHNYEAEDALRYASVTWILDYACKRINESLLIFDFNFKISRLLELLEFFSVLIIRRILFKAERNWMEVPFISRDILKDYSME